MDINKLENIIVRFQDIWDRIRSTLLWPIWQEVLLAYRGGIRGLMWRVSTHYHLRFHNCKRIGKNIFSEDWDVVVILDACRPEWMQQISSEFGFLEEVDTIWSVGSSSAEWMDNTFQVEYQSIISKTAYISANPHAENHSPQDDFVKYMPIYKYGYDSSLKTVPAHEVTDAAIITARNYNPERMIVHYMQPHQPFLKYSDNRYSPTRIDNFNRFQERWSKFQKGELSRLELEDYYLRNLRYVLFEVEILLDNIDADIIYITSDHGNAFGERFLYDHPPVNISPLREVPWVKTSAIDTNSIKPDRIPDEDRDFNPKEQLKALGYQ